VVRTGGAGSFNRWLVVAVSAACAMMLSACSASSDVVPTTWSPEPVVLLSQPLPREQRDVARFIQRPCDLLTLPMAAELELANVTTGRAAAPRPDNPSGCVADRLQSRQSADPLADVVSINPYARDIAGEIESRAPTVPLISVTVVGLPAGLRPDRATSFRCTLVVRTAPAQGLLVSYHRYRGSGDTSEPCAYTTRVAEAILRPLPRRTG